MHPFASRRQTFVGAIVALLVGVCVFATSSRAATNATARQVRASGVTPKVYGDLRWRLVGPFRGGWSEMVQGIPSRPDVFFFGAAGGGVWRTDNAGRTWTSLFDHGPAAPVGAIAIAPSDPQTIYIGTGQPEPRYDVAGGAGVFKSRDGGKTWSPLGLEDSRHIGRIWVSPTDPNVVLVAAVGHFFGSNKMRGVFRSVDGGATWSHVLNTNDQTGAVDLAADPGDANVIFAATWQARQYPWQSYFTPIGGPGSGIEKSSDGGVTWTRMTGQGWPRGPLGRISLATARTAQGLRVYAVVSAAANSGLYRSDDGGSNWSRINRDTGFANYYASRITIAPNDPNVVYLVGQSIRRCTGGGTTCTIIKGAPGGDDYHGVWINPAQPDHIATVSDQGTAISVDGGASWSTWYNQPTGQFYHLATDHRFPYWIYAGQQDSGTVAIVSRSDYGSIGFRDWHPVGGEERDDDIPDPADPSIVYASGLGGSVTRYDSKTGQVAFIGPYPVSNYGQRPTQTQHHFVWVTPLAISAHGPATLYLGAEVLFASSDRGKHWSTISPDLTGKTHETRGCHAQAVAIAAAKPCGYGTIWSLAPSPRHAGEIWVGTDDGLIQLTRNGGRSWRNVTPPGVPVWAKVATIDVSSVQDGVAYAAIDNQRQDDRSPHILKTHDYGVTWQSAAGDLPLDHFVSVVRADPLRAGLLYAGTEVGVFVSFDDGRQWLPLQQNLPTAWVRDLAFDGNDLIAATQGRAIWVLDDIAPLRERHLDAIERQAAHLFSPVPAYRVRRNNYRDTPLPADEPVGKNPPAGAIIDYWLGGKATAAVQIDIRDATGALVQRLSSDAPPNLNADAYFSSSWIDRKPQLSGAPGMHRVTWNLRHARPRSIAYDYSIAAIPGEDTPITPGGPFALPGQYRLGLTVDGRRYVAPLTVRQDPRVSISRAELVASLALSQRIGRSLAQARRGFAESSAAHAALLATLGKLQRESERGTLAAHVAAVLQVMKPRKDGPSFERASETLASIETNLESTDLGPTEPQRLVANISMSQIHSLWTTWAAVRDRRILHLNQALRSAGVAPIVIPADDSRQVKIPAGGQDVR